MVSLRRELSCYESAYVTKLDRNERLRIRRALRRIVRNSIDAPMRIQVLRSNLPEPFRKTVFRQLRHGDDKMSQMVRCAMEIPFETYAGVPKSHALSNAEFYDTTRQMMDSHIFGHDEAKRHVLTMLAQWRAGRDTPFAIALEGPPGIGKTTFVKSALASVLGRPMSTVCLGGASDVSMLLGHSYTYEGARHGRIVQSLIETKVMNPVIFMDELDKVSATARGDELVHALIHLTDPQQNRSIRDRYFQGLDIDVSQCIFVFSYNDPASVNPILLDRLTRIRLTNPGSADKARIVREHILPRMCRGVAGDDVGLADDAVEHIVAHYASESGMRSIERCVHDILSVARLCVQYGSPSIAGLPEGLPVNPRCIGIEFARHVMATRTAAQRTTCPPPAMMFT